VNSEIRRFLNIFAAETNRSRIVAAAEALLQSGAPLDGAPPAEFVAALIESGPAIDQSFLNLARAWSRPEMSRAMLDELPIAPTPQQKEQVAWLLKTVLAAEHSQEAVDRILDQNEDAQVRRWLMEGLERMTFAGPLGWNELDRVVSYLTGQSNPILRTGLASLLAALPWRPTNVSILEPFLFDENWEVVSTAAYTLAGHPDAVRALDTKVFDHLRTHSNPMMRQSAAVLGESIRGAPLQSDP
jgi:hypothetical protein